MMYLLAGTALACLIAVIMRLIHSARRLNSQIASVSDALSSTGQSAVPAAYITDLRLSRIAVSYTAMRDDLSRLQSKIEQMDRMSSLGKLAGGVAHEINNPLTGVLGQAQLLLEKLPFDHPWRATVERIETAAQRCRRIVRGLLDYSRDSVYQFAPVDLHTLIAECLEFINVEVKVAGIIIDSIVRENTPKVMASSPHLQQVFLNIMINAIHAMPGGGTLRISALEDSGMIAVLFHDTGIGIAPEHIAHVFDPFFTTKDIGKGTGLGLSISYGIIQRHGGTIAAVSDGPGCGSTFTVRIPAAPVEEVVS